MVVLSSYRLSEENNRRIAERVKELGGTFLPGFFEEEVDTIIQRIDEYIGEATVLLGGRLTPEQWVKGKKLKWIHVPWAGVNALLSLEHIGTRPVLISNSSGVMADSVADQVAAYLVMLNRNLPNQIRWGVRREWNRYTTVEHPDRKILRGMRLGIVGYGAIGRAVAHRARAFGMEITGLVREARPEELDVKLLEGRSGLDQLLATSDFVLITLPLTPETEGLFGEKEFRMMKPSAFLINVARGKIMQQGALEQALISREIAGAALDVVQEEPLARDSVLWDLDNVIVTPHSSGGFVGFGDRVADLFLENLDRFVAGQELLNPVDSTRGY